jgi:hypothetical protein
MGQFSIILLARPIAQYLIPLQLTQVGSFNLNQLNSLFNEIYISHVYNSLAK